MTMEPTSRTAADWVSLEELRARAARQSAEQATGRRRRDPLDLIFPIAVLTATPAGLFVLWLRSSAGPAAVTAGNWCSVGMGILIVLWICARAIRDGKR